MGGDCFSAVEEEAKIVETHPVLPQTLHRSFILPSVSSTNFYKPGVVQGEGMGNTRHASAQLRSLL